MNRRKEQKQIIQYSAVLFFLLLILLVLSLRISEVKILGNKQYSGEEIKAMLFQEEWDQKSAYAFFKEKLRPHKTLPFIERYEMRWKSPWSVEIIIYEKNMVGYVSYMSSNFYFDGDGVVVESTKKKAPGIPEVKGLKFSSVSLYKALPVENKGVFQDILNLSSSLQQEKITCDYIEYSGTQAIIHVGEIRVLLGGNEDMEQKVMSLRDILPALEGRKGTLDLSEFKGKKEKEAYIFRENK